MIEKVRAWIHWYKKELLFGALIFVVATLSFAFGYLANREFTHAPIIVEKCSEEVLSGQ